MSAPATRDACHPRTLGQHLGARLASLGVKRFFGVPGDYNLALLDELVKEDGLEACWTCNELNAGAPSAPALCPAVQRCRRHLPPARRGR